MSQFSADALTLQREMTETNTLSDSAALCTFSSSDAENAKYALVSANGTYAEDVTLLNFTIKDGDAISEALRASGFSVMYCKNTSQKQMRLALTEFRNILIDAKKSHNEVSAVFYYSGHGLTLDDPDRTFVNPTGFSMSDINSISKNSIDFDQISTASSECKSIVC